LSDKKCKYCYSSDIEEVYEETMAWMKFGMLGAIEISLDSHSKTLLFLHHRNERGGYRTCESILRIPVKYCPKCGRKLEKKEATE
jgi:hypothetical protein